MTTTAPTWVFNDSEIADPFGFGDRAVRFLRALRHPKSTAPNRAFQLDNWQERIVRRIYGPRHPDGTRIVRTVVLLLPRGNRKTTLSAALALLHTIGPERLPSGEVISAAADRKQARLGYAEAAGICRAHPKCNGAVRIVDSRNRITFKAEGSFYEAISADAGTQHGRTPVFVLADELHAWKKRDLWEVLRSGLPKTRGSLCIIATTAGRGQDNIAYELIEYARKVARGEIDDPATLPILFETAPDADWRDESTWRAANPGLSCNPPYPDIEGLRQLAREAANRPGDREAFRQLHLNVWLDQSRSPFVDMAVYDAGNLPVAANDNDPCWIGVDMSATTDLTAVVAAFNRDGDISVVPHFFLPGDLLRDRADRDGVPYPLWADEGHLTATPGNVIDYGAVTDYIRGLCARFDVKEINFDPAYAQPVMAPLMADGFPVLTMRQGWVTQSPALNELERVIVGKRFRHGGHPVLRWNFSNIAIHTDSAGNRTMHKGKSTGRIDGAVATWMAVSRAAANDNNSIYDDAGLRPAGLMSF
ncbi:MAG: terminase large subunit [Parvibaculaceae bacterium]